MTKHTGHLSSIKKLGRKERFIILPLLAVISIGALIFIVVSIISVPRAAVGSQPGVGANGFRAYEENNSDLGMAKVVSRDDVVAALGAKAKSVDAVSVSNVFNLNGNRGQTATYSFVRADGKQASLYVDMMFFKNYAELKSANIYGSTKQTDDLAGHPAYYMYAQTLGSDREYRLMVVNDLKVYKFVITQPHQDITINEVAALASLKKLAAKAHF